MDIAKQIARELGVGAEQVTKAVALLDEGSTVPFIARYRKEVTGGLDDTHLRELEERLRYLRELEERREAVLRSIGEQGKLTPELEKEVRAAETKTRLEDLYLPFKPKRRTKGQIAREAGLEPLAELLFASCDGSSRCADPATEAAAFVDAEKGVPDAAAALEGARSILVERFAEDASLVGELREYVKQHGRIASKVVETKREAGAKFSDYFEFSEPLRKVPSHRVLALLRGRREGVLRVKLVVDDGGEAPKDKRGDTKANWTRAERTIAGRFQISDQGRPADPWLIDTVRAAWSTKLLPHLETDRILSLREAAEEDAIQVFAKNLKDLLLAAPAGPRTTMGLDPALRTGVKVAIVDGTGKFLEHGTIYPHAPKNRWDESVAALAAWARKHAVSLVSIGNGTASRETDRLVKDLMTRHPDLGLEKVVVNESGASVYSASKLASMEFPDLDVSIRGAVSIARRLQDPLSELVKIEPKAIGVGQYQHDVNQTQLSQGLDAVIEDCVNGVGVDVNTASVPLLTRVSGLNRTLAQNIISYRDKHGPFADRGALKSVDRLGDKTFEQSAGFMRVMNGTNPLDASAVHPETYPVVERILQKTGKGVRELIGQPEFLRKLSPEEFTDSTFGVPTVADILKELEKPGRDPRPAFKTATFKEGIETLGDLEVGMILEGVVSNVTNFGAFVDVGVHQDGLAHISQLSYDYVKDPRDIVKAGDVVRVKVLEVDAPRKRIALTMRLEAAPPRSNRPASARKQRGGPPPQQRAQRSGSKVPPGRAARPKRGPSTSPSHGRGKSGKQEVSLFGKMLDEAVGKARKSKPS